MENNQFPLLGVVLEPNALGDSHPDRLAGILIGDGVSAPGEGDERIPTHRAEGLPGGDKPCWWERGEVVPLGFEPVDGSLPGGPVHHGI